MKSLLLIASFLLICSCSTNDDDNTNTPPANVLTESEVRAANEEEIMSFIAVNNLEAQQTESGLFYVVTEEGTGVQPTAQDNVTVAYSGFFTNTVVFDDTDENGLSFDLQNVIPGWTEGIPLFREGGSGILLIPSHLGYGLNGIPGIVPSGAVLIFNINLISVN